MLQRTQLNAVIHAGLVARLREVSEETGKSQREIIEDALSEYLNYTGVHFTGIEDFLAEQQPGEYKASELYSSYLTWCIKKDIPPVTHTAFGKELRRLGIKKVKKSGGWYCYYLE